MRAELEYKSKIYGECPSDYDFSKIQNLDELDFLKRTDILQGVVTRLKYNIDMFEYFYIPHMLNKVIKDEFKGFFSLLLSNLSILIAIDFSNLVGQSGLNIYEYRNFCNTHPKLFKNTNINLLSGQLRPYYDKAQHMFNDYFDTPRNQFFAHIDMSMLDYSNVDDTVGKVNSIKMKELLQCFIKILSEFWYAYNGNNLCFELTNGEDYKKLIYDICNLYGDTRFI